MHNSSILHSTLTLKEQRDNLLTTGIMICPQACINSLFSAEILVHCSTQTIKALLCGNGTN